MAIGVEHDRILRSSPKKLKPFITAYKIRMAHEDETAWVNGMYMMRAVTVAVEHCLAGRKAKSEYFKEPLLKDVYDIRSEEDKMADELRKMLEAEEAWAIKGKLDGLKESVS